MSAKKLRLELLEKMSGLIISGLGLVAALAWNEAIQDLFKRIEIFGVKGSLFAKFGYAFLITVIVVATTYYLSKSVEKLKE
ncbi:MAG: DUF5654 family protein [Candidatus Komeilibacteria bacterium]|nr:DUF5654 family protein [Candidatus Komeilibacteria bacterium]